MRFRQVHLDFHTSEKIDGIGKKFNKEQFKSALKKGNVNSITLFSKCHHGWSYHPSKANKMHPGLDFDLLKMQIDAAHEIGVKTPVYISAGFDEKVAREHPEWRFENREHDVDNFAEPMYHLLCMNTPYLDYLLEQIKEVVQNYEADGIFLDIVGVRPCCCNSCVKEMLERGMNPDDEKDIITLGEEVYANYLKRVRESVDSIKLGMPVFHNGGHIRHGRRDLAFANTHLELESLPTGGWGYDHFPVSARYAWNLGMEYLGMTGRFHNSWGEFGGYKHPNALRYETALSVAHGAKCSIGDQLSPSGCMDMKTYDMIGESYSEIRDKEEWIDNTTPICDIGVLSFETIQNLGLAENQSAKLTDPDVGAGRILIEGKYQFSVIDTDVDFNQFKVVILPDKIVVNQFIKDKLKRFVEEGGKILATGESAILDGEFLFDFGVRYMGDGEYIPSYIKPYYDNDCNTEYIMYTPYKKIELTEGRELAKVVDPYFNRTAQHFCSHKHAPSSGYSNSSGIVQGRDGIYIAWEIFSDYAQNGELIAKKVVCDALDILLESKKSLITNLGSMGVATLMHQVKKNRTIAHLLYAVPTKRGKNTEVIEDIYPIHGVELKVKINHEVKRVYLAPQNIDLNYSIEDNYIYLKNLTINCHSMVVFE